MTLADGSLFVQLDIVQDYTDQIVSILSCDQRVEVPAPAEPSMRGHEIRVLLEGGDAPIQGRLNPTNKKTKIRSRAILSSIRIWRYITGQEKRFHGLSAFLKVNKLD
jgi:hypothetical protein